MASTASLEKLTDAQMLAGIRHLCEQDFAFFAAYFFEVRKRTQFIFSDHHYVLTDDLQDVHAGRKRNVIFNTPPRYSKTELCIVLFVAWCFAKNPRCEFIHLSYSDPLVMTNSDAVKSIIKSKEYQQLWPHITISPHRDAKGAWQTAQGGTFLATTGAGGVTGFGAGRMDEFNPKTGVYTFSGAILIDDPLKPDDARYEPKRSSVNRRWTETIKSRRNSSHTPVICIMQRVHLKDFTAELLLDTEMQWFHRKMRALIDEGLPSQRALWPAKHSIEDLENLRDMKNDRGQVNPIARETFSAQYQQDPTPVGGGLIRSEWWRYYGSVTEARNVCTWFFITADTAYTKHEANDPSALQLWGAYGKDGLYLLDRVRGFWEFPQLLREASRFWARHPYAKRLYIENKASGPSLAQMMRQAITPELKAAGAGVVLWKPKDYRFPDDKVGRVKFASIEIHAGNVWLPDPSQYPWVHEFVDEHDAFTENDTHAHDEDVDCETMAVSIWTRYGGGKRGKEQQA